MKLNSLNEIREILKSSFALSDNLFFFFYFFLTIKFWKYFIYFYLIVNFMGFVRIFLIFLKGDREIFLKKDKPIDVAAFKILWFFFEKKSFLSRICLLIDIFLKYLIVFFLGFSLRSISTCVNFFREYTEWCPAYGFNKIWKIHFFVFYFLKKKLLLEKPYDLEFSNIFFGRVKIKLD